MGWEETQARLEDASRRTFERLSLDIRAALERVSELELEALGERVAKVAERERAEAAEAKLAQAEHKIGTLNTHLTACEQARDYAQAKLAKVLRLHEALLNTLAPSKSAWIQHIWRNAKAALAAAKGE